jgi:hypothetical protein
MEDRQGFLKVIAFDFFGHGQHGFYGNSIRKKTEEIRPIRGIRVPEGFARDFEKALFEFATEIPKEPLK